MLRLRLAGSKDILPNLLLLNAGSPSKKKESTNEEESKTEEPVLPQERDVIMV